MRWYWTKWFSSGRIVSDLTVDDDGNAYFTTGFAGIYQINTKVIPSKVKELHFPENRFKGCVYDSGMLFLCAWNVHNIIAYYTKTRNCFVLANLDSVIPHHPESINIDSKGDILFTCSHSIQKIDQASKVIQMVAGSFESGHRDGLASVAKFNTPSHIAISPDGSLYICDSNNHCIRKFKDGMVTTIAGIPNASGHQDGPCSSALFNNPRGMIYLRDNLLVLDSQFVRRIDLINNIVSTPEQFLCIRNPSSIAMDKKGLMYIGTAGKLFVLESTWKWERFLWMGKMKEDGKSCLLTTLPNEIIKEIAFKLSELLT